MKTTLLFILLSVCSTLVFSQNLPSMEWIGFVKGDIDKAKVSSEYPRSATATNYCVTLVPWLFDPLGLKSLEDESNQTVYFRKM